MQHHRQLRFVSSNPHKIKEAEEILAPHGIVVVPFDRKITELQTNDADVLVRHKALAAFKMTGRPVFVEHTGLYLKDMSGLPGGLTQLFWDALEADRFCAKFGTSPDPRVEARTEVGYIDGRRIHRFSGSISGIITAEPRGPRDFQWDCVFQPDDFDKTFAEMGASKNDISMRRRALDALCQHLERKG